MEQWNLVQKWATLAGVVTTDKEIMHGNCMSHSGAGLHPAGRFFNRPSCTEQPLPKSADGIGALDFLHFGLESRQVWWGRRFRLPPRVDHGQCSAEHTNPAATGFPSI